MSDIRLDLANALQTLLKADSTVTAVVKAENIVVMTPVDGKTANVRPRINIVPGAKTRINEGGGSRTFETSILIEMSVDNNEYTPVKIFDVTSVVSGNKDAFIYNNNGRVSGLPAGDLALLPEESSIIDSAPSIDTDNRIVTAGLLLDYIYHQNTT